MNIFLTILAIVGAIVLIRYFKTIASIILFIAAAIVIISLALVGIILCIYAATWILGILMFGIGLTSVIIGNLIVIHTGIGSLIIVIVILTILLFRKI